MSCSKAAVRELNLCQILNWEGPSNDMYYPVYKINKNCPGGFTETKVSQTSKRLSLRRLELHWKNLRCSIASRHVFRKVKCPSLLIWTGRSWPIWGYLWGLGGHLGSREHVGVDLKVLTGAWRWFWWNRKPLLANSQHKDLVHSIGARFPIALKVVLVPTLHTQQKYLQWSESNCRLPKVHLCLRTSFGHSG